MSSDTQKAYETLKQRVLTGYYKPGTQLKEEPLAEEFSMSRTPIRGALKRLVGDALAMAEPGRGVYVAAWTEWDIEEVFQLRLLLEPFSAQLAAERRDDADLAVLASSNEQMRQAIERGGSQAAERAQAANRLFHQTLLRASRSHRLQSMLETMIDMPIIVRSFHLYSPADMRRSLNHHLDLTLAVQERNGDLAREVMQLHLMMTRQRFMTARKAAEEASRAGAS